MTLLKKLLIATALAALPATTAHSAGVQLGQLTCEVAGGVGFVFGSSKNLECTFTPANDRFEVEQYRGVINKYGIDIGVTRKTVILWTVVAAEKDKFVAGALAGTYSGATGEASFGAGLGANALVGGSRKSFALQPVSVSGGTGVNVAAGFAQIKLSK